MAGVKETPRQQLIGLMYLVFLAMLALQVSSSVLDKFIFLNDSLEQSVTKSVTEHDLKIAAIGKTVSEAGNRESDVLVLNKAKEVRSLSKEIIQKLIQSKEDLIEVTGGKNEATGEPINYMDENNVANLMILKGEGLKLQEEINGYVSALSKLMPELKFEPIALDAADHPLFQDNKNQKGKDFAELNFEHTPLAAALATISDFQNKVLNYESKSLEQLAQSVGADQVKFDKLSVMANPESNVVAAGTVYTADLFIAASSTGITPVMTVDGASIPVDGNGLGKFTRKAKAEKYDKNGRSQQSYTAEIAYKVGGEMKKISKTIDYIVAKPVIQVQAAAVQALYYNCGNELNIQVPALGNAYNPSFAPTGARVLPSSKKGLITVIPSAKKVTLSLSNNGDFIGKETFNVRPVPNPELAVITRGKKVNLKTGLSQCPRSISIKAIPDETFASFLPKEANYKITEWEVTLSRNNKPRAGGKLRFRSQNANITRLASIAKPGDLLFVEVLEVERTNFKGESDPVNLSPSDRYFSIPIGG